MRKLLFVLVVILGSCLNAVEPVDGSAPPTASSAKLLMVTTLTRHGSRSPDKILAKVSCKPLMLKDDPQEHLAQVFIKKFGTLPGELTEFGEEQMREVGRFIKNRYGKQDLKFVDTENYVPETTNWEFIARAGSRQQRSMMAIVEGLFPNTAVPIAVTQRTSDAVLGGPAPQCGSITAQMIVEWQAAVGKELVKRDYETAVAPFEKLCNVSLIDNPVNAAPGGPNPHAWIGDISDFLDSMRENLPVSMQPNYNEESYDALTKLAFDLEQKSHFDDPRGAIMFAGEFPDKLLTTFEAIARNGGKRPSGIPKMRMFACSRELEYGLSHMFGWENGIRLPDQPIGRVLPGSTIIWELWQINGKLYIDTLLYQPGMRGIMELQRRISVDDYRNEYLKATANIGDWKKICGVNEGPPRGSLTGIVADEAHTSRFWFVLFFMFALLFGLVYLGNVSRAGYQRL